MAKVSELHLLSILLQYWSGLDCGKRMFNNLCWLFPLLLMS